MLEQDSFINTIVIFTYTHHHYSPQVSNEYIYIMYELLLLYRHYSYVYLI